jgi:hypothetical protein
MAFNKKEIKIEINKFLKCYKEYNEEFNKLDAVLDVGCESPIFESVFSLFDLHIALLEQKMNDSWNTLSWYVFENECGKARLEAGPKDNSKKIKNLDDLFWLVKVQNQC